MKKIVKSILCICFFLLVGAGCETISESENTGVTLNVPATTSKNVGDTEIVESSSDVEAIMDIVSESDSIVSEVNASEVVNKIELPKFKNRLHRGHFGITEEELESGVRNTPDAPMGTVEYHFINGRFQLFGQLNLDDDLLDGEYYNGWLYSRKDSVYLDVGKLKPDTTYGELIYLSNFLAEKDYTSYNVYIVSKEHGDSGNSPANEEIRFSIFEV
ncbi:MAG: hypothetical protein ABII02_04550 [Candidatus Magasanikbacteria bacterium]